MENGELKTEIPFLAAWVRSTWLVPIQKHPITTSYALDDDDDGIVRAPTLGQASMTLAVILVLDRIPTPWYWGSFWINSSSVNARVW